MAKAKKSNYESFRAELGAEIKARRNEKGMSTRQLAEHIKKTQPRIPEIEAGRTKELDTYLKCLGVLGGRLQIIWDN
jgi:ribosome-binding protein aMBF1 (putative translation factor)